jgi:hypothetical protein
MSRFTIKHRSIDSVRAEYGYDRPLQYYFFQIWRGDQLLDSDDFAGCTARTLLHKLIPFRLPLAHVEDLTLDLPLTEDFHATSQALDFDRFWSEAEASRFLDPSLGDPNKEIELDFY